MNAPRLRTVPFFLAAFALSLAVGARASASPKIPFLLVINTGDAIYKVAELPPELASIPDLKGWALGYKCSHFGILWADFACWDKQLVVFKDDTYSDIPADIRVRLELKYPFSSCERNPWNRYGFLLLGGLVVGGFAKRLSS